MRIDPVDGTSSPPGADLPSPPGPSLRPPPPPPTRRQEWIIGLVVVPLSFLTSCWEHVATSLSRWRRSQAAGAAITRREHGERVARVQRQVTEWASMPAGSRPPLRTDRTASESLSVRVPDKTGAKRVRLGDFRHILDLDLKKGTVTVEPFVTVGEVTSFLLRHGLMLEATLEMEDATLGGLALSQGMTTHSHRCGLVSDTVTDYELVTGDGKIVVASETQNTDVFRAIPFSHGSLGFLTSLSLRVVPAQKELLVSYRKFGSVKELQEALVASVETTDAFFLEGVIHSTSHTVLIRGDLVSGDELEKLKREGVPTNKQGQWWKEWFFVHTSKVEDGHRELMPMHDYLMRHDKSLCMTMKYVFPAGNHPLLRYTLGWMLPPRVQFLKSLRPPDVRMETAQSQVYQDLAVPHESFCELVDLAKTEFDIFPLMVYPCKIVDRGGFIRIPSDLRHGDPASHLYLNMGLYGVPRGVRKQTLGYSTIGSVRRVLDLVRSRGGFQHSYCDVFQTPEEFEEMFDHALANEVRKRVGSEALPGVYGKVRPEVDWEKEVVEAA